VQELIGAPANMPSSSAAAIPVPIAGLEVTALPITQIEVMPRATIRKTADDRPNWPLDAHFQFA
jgi:hypothetical protein